MPSSSRGPLRLLALLLASTGISIAEETSTSTPPAENRKPTLFLIGDSTVKNGTSGMMGWGTPIEKKFDPDKIVVKNRALGGRSSRTFLREGLWDKVRDEIRPGDFVIMQFGHNDNGPMDEGKARASIKGNGDETRDVVIKETNVSETVSSYGAYLRQYISDAKSRGATAIVCSLVPRNIWRDGKVVEARKDYGQWAREAAQQGGALFVDLNAIISRRYDEIGAETVGRDYFTTKDHTHTNAAGAELNAECVVEGIRGLEGCPLADALRTAEKGGATR